MEIRQCGQSVEDSWRACMAKVLATILPLLKGEGWGEGEGDTRLVTAADPSKPPHHHSPA